MDTGNDCETASIKDGKTFKVSNKSEQNTTGVNQKSARKVQESISALSKADSRFWLQSGKLKKSNGSPNYSLQIQFKGQRVAFTTRTGNREASARIAAGIYSDLLTLGIDGTIAKHRPETVQSETVATVGEWIKAARDVSEANDSTFNCYSCSLRKIVGDILAIKKTKARFGPGKGGAAEYRQAINGASLEILTLPAVQKWRLEAVKQAKNPVQERSRMTTCNSTIRQAMSLFSGKILKFLPDMVLPSPMPFAGVDFFPKQSAKYFSRIDPKALLQAAHTDLAGKDPSAFVVMLLALSAGLRKGEIDSLAWHQVDFERQLIRVESTEKASLKTTDSRDEVAIDEHIVALLRGYRARSSGDFVIDATGEASGPSKWGQQYRAAPVFDRLTAWLRAHGVTARKPLHELRKELGALVTAEHGIYAASRVLRHSNVATTAAHYSDLKTRPVVNIGGWLQPENVTAFPLSETKGTPLAGERKKQKKIV